MVNLMTWHGNYVKIDDSLIEEPHLLKCIAEDGNLCMCCCSDCVNRDKGRSRCTCSKCACGKL